LNLANVECLHYEFYLAECCHKILISIDLSSVMVVIALVSMASLQVSCKFYPCFIPEAHVLVFSGHIAQIAGHHDCFGTIRDHFII